MNKPGMPFKIKDSNHNMGSDEVMIDEDMESHVKGPKKLQSKNYQHQNSNQNYIGKYMNH